VVVEQLLQTDPALSPVNDFLNHLHLLPSHPLHLSIPLLFPLLFPILPLSPFSALLLSFLVLVALPLVGVLKKGC
jgi:hypothetical protein